MAKQTNGADPLNIKEESEEELEKIDHKFDSKLGVLKIDDDSSNDADQDIKDEKTSIPLPQNLILLSEDGTEDVNPLPAVKSEDPLDINNCKLEDFDDEEEEEDNDTKDADIKGIFVPKLLLKTEFSGVKRETQQESFKQELDDVEEKVVIKTESEEICEESDNNEEGNTEGQDGLSDSDSNTENTPSGNSNAENIQPEDQSDTGHTSNSIAQSTSVNLSKRKRNAGCSKDVVMSDVSVVSNKSSSAKKNSTKKRKEQQQTKEASAESSGVERETEQGILNKEVDDNNVDERVVVKTEPEEICEESDNNEEGNTEDHDGLSDSDSNTENTPSGNSNVENIQPDNQSDTGHTSNSITQSTSVNLSKRKRSAVCSSDVLPDKPNKTVKSSLMSDVSVVSSNKRKNTGKQINIDNKSNSTKKCSTEKDSTEKRKEQQQTKEASEVPREISVKKNSVKANDENVKNSKKTKGRKVYKLKCPVLAYLCICGSWCKTGPELSNHLSVCSRLQPRVFLKRINS